MAESSILVFFQKCFNLQANFETLLFFRKVNNGSLAKYFKQKRIKDKTIGSGRKAYPFKRFKQMGHLSGSYYLSNECLRQVASHPSG